MTLKTTTYDHGYSDKLHTARYIRLLMDRAGLSWREVDDLVHTKQAQTGTLPESWKQARGLLKGRSVDPLEYQERCRSEWDNYPDA